jgi:hypothetical protein
VTSGKINRSRTVKSTAVHNGYFSSWRALRERLEL